MTGAGRGIGREYALLLAQRGAHVVVNNRTVAMAEQVVSEITSEGGSAVADGHDITSQPDGYAVIDTAIERFGRVDIVINNAGITSNWQTFDQTDIATLDTMFNVHVRGSWFVTQRAWPHMVEQGYGRVLMTISAAGLWGQLQSQPYSLCKGALMGLTRSLALDGRPHGVHVNAFSPAGFTRMVSGTAKSGNEGLVAHLRKIMPAELLAPAASWLVHEDCEVTGMYFSGFGPVMSRVVMHQTRGFRCEPEDYTIEAIRDHFGDVLNEERSIHEDILIRDIAQRIAALLGVPSPIP